MTYAGENACLRDTKSYIIPSNDDLIAGGNYNTTVVGRAYIKDLVLCSTLVVSNYNLSTPGVKLQNFALM